METLYASPSIRVEMTEQGKGATKGEGTGWSSPSRIDVTERSPARLEIKYRYHLLSETRARGLILLGIALISVGLLAIVTGVLVMVLWWLVIGTLVLGLTWYYPRSYRNIVINKEAGEISFSDSSVFSERLPMSIPFGHVKCLTIASKTMASKPEHLLSVTLHPVPQGPFHIGNFTHLLVKSYIIDEIEELGRIISEFSDIRVVRQS
jgi:hypothetical protein